MPETVNLIICNFFSMKIFVLIKNFFVIDVFKLERLFQRFWLDDFFLIVNVDDAKVNLSVANDLASPFDRNPEIKFWPTFETLKLTNLHI